MKYIKKNINPLFLIFTKKRMKKIVWLFSPTILYILYFFAEQYFSHKSMIFSIFDLVVFSSIVWLKLQTVIVFIFTYIYLRKKSLFFILYFLFLIFYLLFFIFYIQFYIFIKTDFIQFAFTYILDPKRFFFFLFAFIYSFVFVYYAIKEGKQFFYRYIFSFLSAISVLIIYNHNSVLQGYYDYYKYFNSSISSLFVDFIMGVHGVERQTVDYFYIPLIFVSIQLFIEVYYFFQREKPKWDRYNRMKKYNKINR
jgi:hypothetical protein